MASFDKRLKEITTLICGLMDDIDEVEATTEAEIRVLATSEEKMEMVITILRSMNFNMFYLEKMKSKMKVANLDD